MKSNARYTLMFAVTFTVVYSVIYLVDKAISAFFISLFL